MKTPQEIIEKKEKFLIACEIKGKLGEIMLNNLLISLLQSDIDELEGMKQEPLMELEGADGEDCRIYNQTLSDIIQKKQQKLKELTN